MDCSRFEDLLSEYMESNLPNQEMTRVSAHLKDCSNCSRLLGEMQSAVELCKNYPVLEIDLNLVEKILLRTSGRPRHRSAKELWTNYFLKPLITPRFAVGAGLGALFLVLLSNSILPRVSPALSAFSPPELSRLMDRGVQKIYGEGLKAYKTKTDLEEQFVYLKDNIFGKLRFLMEKIDIPVEGSRKSVTPDRGKEKAPNEKSSALPLLRASLQEPVQELGCAAHGTKHILIPGQAHRRFARFSRAFTALIPNRSFMNHEG
jgi:hypothetical protein